MNDINKEYLALIKNLRQAGHEQFNKRTGHNVKALPAQHLTVSMSTGFMPLPGWRKVFPKSALAETLWMLMGTTNPEWINQHTGMWKLWIEDDGSIPTAYGYRWRVAFGRDQFIGALDALTADPSSRQVNVFAWHPGEDGNGAPNQPKNIPCVMGFTVNIIEDRLNMSVYLRSSDVIVGLPYDYMCYGFLLNFIASSLRVLPGTLCLHLAHAHYYRVHDDIVDHILENKPKRNYLSGMVLGTSVSSAISMPDDIIKLPMTQSDSCDYNPKPELVL